MRAAPMAQASQGILGRWASWPRPWADWGQHCSYFFNFLSDLKISEIPLRF
jgi:hypothetical protein